MAHNLRRMVGANPSQISDAELTELETLLPFEEYQNDFEYSGNFIITKDEMERDERVENMCCGIISRDIELSNGEMIYFAFDYGH